MSMSKFIVDTGSPSRCGIKRHSTETDSLKTALQRAKRAGRSDIPAVVWEHQGSGRYLPKAVVVDGHMLCSR